MSHSPTPAINQFKLLLLPTSTHKDIEFRQRLQWLDRLASRIAKTKGDLFEFDSNRKKTRFDDPSRYVRVRRLGHDLYQQIQQHFSNKEFICEYLDIYRISPIVSAFLETLDQDSGTAHICFQLSKIAPKNPLEDKYPFTLSAFLYPTKSAKISVQTPITDQETCEAKVTEKNTIQTLNPGQNQALACQYLNTLVDTLRDTFNNTECKSSLKNFRRLSNKNYAGLIELINGLRNHYQDIAAIYVRFEYELTDDCNKRDMYADRQTLVSLKGPLRTMSVGYALKIEHFSNGPILHGILFYRASDTNRLADDVFSIYKYWYEEATSKWGKYPNQKTMNRRYILAQHRTPLPIEIQSMATMITKFDYYAQSKGKGRTFTKSTLPRTVKRQTSARSKSKSSVKVGDQ
ncbi:hypothetical protein HW932_19465 [Allochromatium humboldtianum]|uniref:Uncharacterized protein n=1 Tax=Allochromatium humboldtianum TaxID=504901 RepID=A0A850RBP9_9GAMM|nr:hypothetical protein [Allochromatium humboldtianum]NVZ11434.1 hypothetical protein [Allochromatium humboldtianum]